MEVVQLLGSAMGLGFVSGLNLYATIPNLLQATFTAERQMAHVATPR